MDITSYTNVHHMLHATSGHLLRVRPVMVLPTFGTAEVFARPGRRPRLPLLLPILQLRHQLGLLLLLLPGHVCHSCSD
jgi:hypothetical protein